MFGHAEQLDDNSSLIYESLGRVTTCRQLKITASDWQWLVLPSLLISSILPGEIPEISIVFSFNQNGYFQTIDRILRTLCWMDSILGDAPHIKKNPAHKHTSILTSSMTMLLSQVAPLCSLIQTRMKAFNWPSQIPLLNTSTVSASLVTFGYIKCCFRLFSFFRQLF